ncbi:Ribosome-binding ATPase YchF [subsurface metagenome]
MYEIEKLHPIKKITQATVDIVDIPGLTKGASHGEGVGNKFLGDIRNTDALIHVLRCFDDKNLTHIEGSVDPVRDIETIDLELQVKDLETIEKKMDRIEKLIKIGDRKAGAGMKTLTKVREHLENFGNVRDMELDERDMEYISDLFLLTIKPIMYVCNVDEISAIEGNTHVENVKTALSGKKTEILVIAGKLEAEIAEFDDENDRKVFLEDTGLDEPGVNKLVRSAYNLLNLQSFFTVGPKEIRAWTIKKGMNAQQAAGVVHSDMERGFIRAEVMKYKDFIELGSENECRHKGKLYVEGKNYIVDDGDMLHIRFNV